MARYLGVGSVFKSPRTTHTYTVAAAEAWADLAQPIRPPAHIIGVGGFGATYRVVDERGAAFAMKEYFPRDHAVRGTDGRIAPRRDEEGFSRKIYEEGLRRFVAEGHLLTSFNHPNVLKVVDAFDDNGTSYQLMRLVEGREQLGESDTGAARIERRVTFEDFLRELEAGGVAIDLPLIRPVVKQLLDAVEYIHTEGTRKAQEITGAATRALLHRDIKPSNILIEAPEALKDAGAEEILRHADTRAILIDFGSARIFRDVQEDDVSRSIGVVTEGYAPPELKDNDIDQQGPHSDIYSIAAVIWRALMGRKPTTAQLANGAKIAELATPITLPDGKTTPRASKAFLQAIDRALSPAVRQRPQSVAEWRAELSGQAAVHKDAKKAVRTGDGERKKGGQAWLWWAMTAGFIAVSAYGFWQTMGGPSRGIESEASAAAKDAEQAVKIAEETAVKADAAASEAAPLVEQAVAKAKEGKEAYDGYMAVSRQEVFHAYNQGEERLGDKFRSVPLDDGTRANWWCHKKGPDITPEMPYDSYKYKEFTIDGEPGWACSVSHTHHVAPEVNGPRSPWHIEGAGFVYDGELDAQMRPSGLGVMSFADRDSLGGRFTQDGANYVVLGGDPKENIVRGRVTVTMSSPPKPEVGLVSFQAKGVVIREEFLGDRDVGVVALTTTRTGLKWKDGFMGRDKAVDGTETWTAGLKQAWGRIDRSDGTYLGQITDGKPDGCGVWKWRTGPKEVGFYTAGAKQPGELPEACKRPHYRRPVDLDAVARDGAKALPQ